MSTISESERYPSCPAVPSRLGLGCHCSEKSEGKVVDDGDPVRNRLLAKRVGNQSRRRVAELEEVLGSSVCEWMDQYGVGQGVRAPHTPARSGSLQRWLSAIVSNEF